MTVTKVHEECDCAFVYKKFDERLRKRFRQEAAAGARPPGGIER
jgi:hypothetical protein